MLIVFPIFLILSQRNKQIFTGLVSLLKKDVTDYDTLCKNFYSGLEEEKRFILEKFQQQRKSLIDEFDNLTKWEKISSLITSIENKILEKHIPSGNNKQLKQKKKFIMF